MEKQITFQQEIKAQMASVQPSPGTPYYIWYELCVYATASHLSSDLKLSLWNYNLKSNHPTSLRCKFMLPFSSHPDSVSNFWVNHTVSGIT